VDPVAEEEHRWKCVGKLEDAECGDEGGQTEEVWNGG
jgi:hypothetical protein